LQQTEIEWDTSPSGLRWWCKFSLE
jgi:hypothetical protein